MNAINIISMAVVSLLFFSSSSHADGNKLLAQCLDAERYLDSKELGDQFNIGVCLGLVQGVRNTMQLMGNDGSIKVCIPKYGITNGQATRIVTSYLKKNPASLHKNEVVLTMFAFIEAYPCK